MANIRILLVDDYPYFHQAVIRLLRTEPQFEVVGSAGSGEDALEQVSLLLPDVVLLDFTLPGMNGLETLSRIKARPNAPYVIIATLHDCREYREAVEAAGGDGFITKSEFGSGILPLMETLLSERAKAKSGNPAPLEHLNPTNN